MPRRLRLLSSALAATLLLSLTACGEEPSPPRPPSINIQMPSDGGGDAGPSDGGGGASPSDGGGDDGSEGEPTAAAPDVSAPNPDDYPHRDLRTPEGAEQAVRYYFALVFWGYETGDPAPIEAMQSSTCETCDEFPQRIREVRRSSEYWQDVHIEDIGIKTYDSSYSEHEIGYIFTLRAGVGGYEGDSPEGADYVAVVGVDWVDNAWQVKALSFEGV